MDTEEVLIVVLGAPSNVRLAVQKECFQSWAKTLRGTVVVDPPPFAAACTDGLIIIFNLMMGPMDVRGAHIVFGADTLNAAEKTSMAEAWRHAKKAMSIQDALKHFQLVPFKAAN